MNQFKLSIFFVTYNHRVYLRQAIESFLTQETNFAYNIAVYDDCSNDGSQDILHEYEEKYPDRFFVEYASENHYGTKAWEEATAACQKKYCVGDYIAVGQGDDYWNDSKKLQIQVDFMEAHPHCMLTGHASHWLDCVTGEEWDFHPHNGTGYLTPEELIVKPNGNISTASLVFRREAFFWDENFPKASVGDYPRQMYALAKGDVYYFDKIMSVYRSRRQGSWTEHFLKDAQYHAWHMRDMATFLAEYDEYTNGRFYEPIMTRRNWCLKEAEIAEQQAG